MTAIKISQVFRRCLLGTIFGACVTLAGCGGETIPRATVEGTVSYEGKPLENGAITFVPIIGVVGAPVQLTIKDGQYSSVTDAIDSRGVVIGQNDVQIVSSRKTGKQVKNPENAMVDEIVQFIPAKYNEKTELRHDIKAGKNKFDFDLK